MLTDALGFLLPARSGQGLDAAASARRTLAEQPMPGVNKNGGVPSTVAKVLQAEGPIVPSERSALKPLLRDPRVGAALPVSARRRLWQRLAGVETLKAKNPQVLYKELACARGLPRDVVNTIETDTRTVSTTFRGHALFKQAPLVAALDRVLFALVKHTGAPYSRPLCHTVAFLMAVYAADMSSSSTSSRGGSGSTSPGRTSTNTPAIGTLSGAAAVASAGEAALQQLEEDIFWTAAAMMETLALPQGLRVEQAVLEGLVARKLPRLASHLVAIRVRLGTLTGPWLSSLYLAALPPVLALRVWDCLLCEGPKVLHRVALALLKMYEQTVTSVVYPEVLRKVLDLRVGRTSEDDLFALAFKGIGSLPTSQLATLRAQHLRCLAVEDGTLGGGAVGAVNSVKEESKYGRGLTSTRSTNSLGSTTEGRLSSESTASSSNGAAAAGGPGPTAPVKLTRSASLMSSLMRKMSLSSSSSHSSLATKASEQQQAAAQKLARCPTASAIGAETGISSPVAAAGVTTSSERASASPRTSAGGSRSTGNGTSQPVGPVGGVSVATTTAATNTLKRSLKQSMSAHSMLSLVLPGSTGMASTADLAPAGPCPVSAHSPSSEGRASAGPGGCSDSHSGKGAAVLGTLRTLSDDDARVASGSTNSSAAGGDSSAGCSPADSPANSSDVGGHYPASTGSEVSDGSEEGCCSLGTVSHGVAAEGLSKAAVKSSPSSPSLLTTSAAAAVAAH